MIEQATAQFPNLKVVATTLREVRIGDAQRLGRRRVVRRQRLRARDAPARPRDPRPRRRRRQLRRGARLRDARGHGAERCRRMGRRTRRAGDDDAGRYVDGDARRGAVTRRAVPARASGDDARRSANCRSAARSSGTSTARSRTTTRERRWTQRGSSACATSTPRRTTVSACPSDGSALRSPAARATSTSSRRRSAVSSSRSTCVAGLDDDGFVVPATHRRRWDFSRDGIRRSLEESLERLGLDRVDILYLHDPDDHWDDVSTTGYPALAELRARRRRRRRRRRHEPVGDARRPRPARRRRPADARRPLHAARTGRPGRPAAPVRGARRRRSSPRASSTAACSRDRDRRPTRSTTTETRRPQLIARASAIAAVCERHGTTLPAAAIAFPLAHPAVLDVCVGARSAEQIRRNAALHRRDDPGRALERAEGREGLLREDAPVPGSAA